MENCLAWDLGADTSALFALHLQCTRKHNVVFQMNVLTQGALKLFEAVIERAMGRAGSLGRLDGERAETHSGVNC